MIAGVGKNPEDPTIKFKGSDTLLSHNNANNLELVSKGGLAVWVR